MIRPDLQISDLLNAIDAFHKRWRRWPTRNDGPVRGMLDVTWCGIDQALKKGNRGLPGGSSLPRLLHEHRRVRHRLLLPLMNVDKILAWADAHHANTGKWPTWTSGQIDGVPGETWTGIDKALRHGRRGLPCGSSLGQLLAQHRGVRNQTNIPRLTGRQILAWADAHCQRTGRWPTRLSGKIPEASVETWHAVDAAFVADARGLAGFGSLRRFLAAKRGLRNPKNLPDLNPKQILAWARDFMRRTGMLPRHTSGPIPHSDGETWGGIHVALYRGRRGMPKSSLFQFLQHHTRQL